MSEEIAVPESNESSPVESAIESAAPAETVPGAPKEQDPEIKAKVDEELKENHDVRRMKRLLYERAEAQAEAAALRAQLEKQKPQDAQQVKPDRSSFSDDDSFYDALTDWKLEQKLPEMVKRFETQKAKASIESGFQQREVVTKQEHPDYDDVIADNGHIQIPRETVEAILSSDVGPDIRYYLAKNPEKAQSLQGMNPIAAVREIGRIEAQILGEKEQRKQPIKTTKAPVPIKPVSSGSGAVEIDLDKLPMKDFIKRREESLKARQKR